MIGYYFKFSEVLCMMKDVLVSGVKLKVEFDFMVLSYFFIIINGFYDEIGCMLVKWMLELVFLKFNMLFVDDFIEMILCRNMVFEFSN